MKKFAFLFFTIILFNFPVHAQEWLGYTPKAKDEQEKIESRLRSETNWDRFKYHLEQITKDPHPAGSPANDRVRDYIHEVMKNAGWEVTNYPYDILLPKAPGTDYVALVRPVRLPLNNQEVIIEEDPYSAHPDLWHGWNAWSGSGDVTAGVVYANFGRKEDFEALKKMGISVKGKVVIARYGGNFRGYKAKFAEEYGAAALIIYTDPADAGYMKGLTYPDGPYYNESAIQRGSLLTVDYTGDALTPFEPALPLDGKKKVKRLKPEEAGLHTIPVTPLPYGSAKEILSRMQGTPVPQGWQGGLPFTYRIEGGSELQVRVKVEQKKEMTRVANVVGTLKGKDYPDEWVILGCHFDAWSFGATDPNSGTAMLLALSETLGRMANAGDRPSRSILIAHWDAEEHGVIGSSEWVEQLLPELQNKTIAYINLDAAVSGRNFGSSASPTLKQVVMDASREIAFPDSSKTLYEVWAKGKEEPSMGNLGGGSDHIGFYMHAGIPSLSAGLWNPTLYHTNYDNMHFYSKFSDPTFKMGGMMEQFTGTLAMRLANAPVIPYDILQYATDLKIHFEKAEKAIKAYHPDFDSFGKVHDAIEDLEAAAEAYNAALDRFISANPGDQKKIKALNKALIALEKSFLDPKGMYYGAWYRSLYASLDPFSGYASWMLPGLQYEIELKSTDRLDEWEERYTTAIRSLEAKIRALIPE